MPALSSIISSDELYQLLHRLDLEHTVVRRSIEEQICNLVPVSPEWLQTQLSQYLNGKELDSVLKEESIDQSELYLRLSFEEKLRIYAEYMFSSGVEQYFLSTKPQRDKIVYSFIRVSSAALAQELWIRIAEENAPFSELASAYSEGNERNHKGLIGPLPVASIHPEPLRNILLTLRPGEVSPPSKIGAWHVILRLETLEAGRLDTAMRQRLHMELLDNFLAERTKSILSGAHLDPLYYNP